MRFYSAISEQESSADAVAHLLRSLKEQAVPNNGLRADVAFVFLTAHHRENAADVLERLWLELDPQTIVGCSAEGVIGGELEIEREPGISVLVGELAPDVRIHPFHVDG